GQPLVADFQARADRIFAREEALGDAGPDNGHLRHALEVLVREDGPLAQPEVHDLEVARVDADDLAAAVAGFAGDDAVDHHLAAHPRHLRNRGANRLRIEPAQAGREALRLLLAVLLDLAFL